MRAYENHSPYPAPSPSAWPAAFNTIRNADTQWSQFAVAFGMLKPVWRARAGSGLEVIHPELQLNSQSGLWHCLFHAVNAGGMGPLLMKAMIRAASQPTLVVLSDAAAVESVRTDR